MGDLLNMKLGQYNPGNPGEFSLIFDMVYEEEVLYDCKVDSCTWRKLRLILFSVQAFQISLSMLEIMGETN